MGIGIGEIGMDIKKLIEGVKERYKEIFEFNGSYSQLEQNILMRILEKSDKQSEEELYFDILVAILFFHITRENEPDVYQEIIKQIDLSLIPKEFYPGPTAIERIQHVFAELLPMIEHKKGYIRQERHYIYSGIFQEPTAIQLELPGMETEDSLAKIDKEIAGNSDALALKVFHAVLAECYRQHKDWGAYCYWDMNTFCDMLDYKRDKNGYHQTMNVKHVEKRLKMLAKLKYRFEIIGYDPKTKADRIVFEGPLLRIEPDQTVSLFRGTERIAKKSTLRIHDELHKTMMKRKMFAWYDKEFLRLNPQQHSRAILLYTYYASQLAMGAKQRKDKHVVRRPIETVLRETGIVIDTKHKGRNRESFIQAHKELKRRELINGFVITWCKNQIEIMFPVDHPSIKEKQAKMAIEGDIKSKLPV